MIPLKDIYVSSGYKFFAHQEAMHKLRNGQGQPIVSHVMLTDVCNHKCAFCSVQHRTGDSLEFNDIVSYLDILQRYGLKAVILSGGGNPILYKCKRTGHNFNHVVGMIHARGLEIGLITNGMPLRIDEPTMRKTWKGVYPETLDMLTWIRISMSGLDHDEKEVFVPDVNPRFTTLGFSYVAHDVYDAPEDKAHGRVSTQLDLINLGVTNRKAWTFESRIEELTGTISDYVIQHNPKYVRLLPNCLEPALIAQRCVQLTEMSEDINSEVGREVAFVQQKPPQAPHACLLGVIHPVLNCDGFVYPCDSVVLNEEAGHKFDSPWRICHWTEIAKLYDNKLPNSLIDDTSKRCPGCVFTHSNEILIGVRDGTITPTPPVITPTHVNFV